MIVIYGTSSGVAYAMGDISIIYWFSGAALLHIILFYSLLTNKSFSIYKKQYITIYVSVISVVWILAYHYKGPEFFPLYICVYLLPIVLIFCFFWTTRENKEK
jgi:hypothetical protein